jgi:hypothetical protein
MTAVSAEQKGGSSCPELLATVVSFHPIAPYYNLVPIDQGVAFDPPFKGKQDWRLLPSQMARISQRCLSVISLRLDPAVAKARIGCGFIGDAYERCLRD